MTKKKVGREAIGEDMPHASKEPAAKNSTSTNAGAKKVGTVKGTPKNNKKHKHQKVPRY